MVQYVSLQFFEQPCFCSMDQFAQSKISEFCPVYFILFDIGSRLCLSTLAILLGNDLLSVECPKNFHCIQMDENNCNILRNCFYVAIALKATNHCSDLRLCCIYNFVHFILYICFMPYANDISLFYEQGRVLL